ncbi:ABC-type xenobiotic transporter [Malassezia obtusa]|uniref:ABC-type xenobiotic transporter n=1 Tax=Malassezia obtusa TaxID=76774 RepID=A0AAF0IRW4_9BASI|nr:ABC-type xenobiotic transporter [Malassezia obtusa]
MSEEPKPGQTAMAAYEAPFREALIKRHRSRLPGFFYLFSFAPALPSPFRAPVAFVRHPVVLYLLGVLCALVAGGGLSSIDLLYGYWSHTVKEWELADPAYAQRRSNLLAWINVVIGVLVFFTSWGFLVLLPQATHELCQGLREEYFAAAIVQDPGFFDAHGPGEIASRANRDVTHIRAAFGEKLGFFLNSVATLIASLVMSFSRAPTVAGVLLTVLIFACLVTTMLGALGDMVTSSALDVDSRLSTFVEQVLASVRVVHSFELTQTLVDRMHALYIEPLARYITQRSMVKGGDVSAMYLVINALYSFGFWWGSVQIAKGREHMDGVISCFYNYLSSIFCLAMVVPHLQSLIENAAALRKMRAVIEREPHVDVRSTAGEILGVPAGAPNPDGLPTYEPSFALEHVTFAYPARPYDASLRDVSICFPPGKVTALVGPSGSGKSTITALLSREYDPATANVPLDGELRQRGKPKAHGRDAGEKSLEREATSTSRELGDVEAQRPRVQGSGEVLFAGVDVRALNLRWLRSQIAVVRQNPQLFSGTIAENVAMGLTAVQPNVSLDDAAVREQVKQALIKAEAWSFVKRLPQGMDTHLAGGRNVHLSGGQRQRIAIARALVREPQILCLDEATSALDTSTEERIKRMLQREQEKRGMTTIIVAHRLSTVQQADQIVTLKHGAVAEVGTHAELMRNRDGIYHSMVMHNRVASGAPLDDEPLADGAEATEPAETTTQASRSEAQPVPPPHELRPDERDAAAKHWLPSMHADVANRGTGVTNARWGASDRRDEARDAKQENSGAGDMVGAGEAQDASGRRPGLWHITQGQHLIFVFGLAFAVALAASFPITGWISGYAIDALGIQNDPARLRSRSNWWGMWFIVVGAIALVVGFLASFLLELASERMMNTIKVKSLHALLRQEVAFFDRRENGSGALSAGVFSHAASIGSATGVVAVQLIMAGGNLLGSVIMAIAMSWEMALTTVPGLLSLIVASFFNVRLAERYEKTVQEPIDGTASYIAEIIDAIPTVASLGREMPTVRRMARESTVKRPYRVEHALSGMCFAYSQFALYGSTGLMLYWGTHLVMTRRISASSMFAVFEGVFIGIFAAVRLATFLPDIARARYAIECVGRWWARQPQVAVATHAAPWPPHGPRDLVLQDVELRYPQRPDASVLRDVNLTIHENQTVAFCGTSGSGKSSMLSLLQRFYDPCRGTITYGGIDLRAIPLPTWRAEMAYVSQDPVLYEGTLRWNLLLGAVDAERVTDAELEEACRAACVWDFAMALPEGLDTMIGLKGSSLSGGQRQRVCIARALLRRPKILLLDEATSALDAESEVLVQQALDNACRTCTTITIAHRLSTIRRADLICVVEDGVIVERGTHDELLHKHGRYFELVEAQL